MPSESWLPGVDRGCAGCIVVARGERSTRKTQPPRNRAHDATPRAQHALSKAAPPVGPAPQTDTSYDHHTRLTTGTVLIASLDLALGN